MRVELAGRTRVVVGDHVVDGRALGGVVARRVLAVLALERRAVSRDELGDAVWGETLPKTWETALRGAVHQLRRAVSQLDDDAELIRTAFGCYQLAPDVTVDVLVAAEDVDQAEAALAAGAAEPGRELAGRAARVLGQPVLVGVEGEWLDEQRRRLGPAHLRALVSLSSASTAIGDHVAAAAAASAALEIDPFLESGHRQLMAALAAAGDRAAALVAYRRCRALLADELGLDPSELTEAAHRSVLANAPAAGPAGPLPPVALPASLVSSLPLAGRTPPLARLTESWEAVAAGAGRAVAVVGPAGIGKSRLAAELAAIAHAGGAAVVHGRFDPDDLGAFGALGEVFGQLGVAWPPPELVAGGGPIDRGMLFDDAAGLLRAAGARRPLVVVLDDAHWADRPSGALLHHLASVCPAGVLLLTTARDDWLPAKLADLLDVVDRVDLGPLDADGLDELVTAWAGQRPDPGLVAQLELRTGGNPFFATVLLQDLAERGRVPLTSGIIGLEEVVGAVPASMGGLVGTAVARCGDAVAEVAAAGAVLGDEFRVELVAAVVGCSPATVMARLERLVHARILGHAPSGPGQFRFVHALVRDGVLADVDDDRRRRLHRRAVAALDAGATDDPAGVLRHLLAVGDPLELPRAVALGLDLSHDLVERGAAEEAAHMLGTLHDLLDRTSVIDLATRASVQFALGMAEMAMDDIVVARQHLRQATRSALALGDLSVLVSAGSEMRPPPIGHVDLEMVDLVEQLVELSAPGSSLRAMTLCWLAVELSSGDEALRASALGAEAVGIARALGDPIVLRQALLTWHLMSRPFVPADRRRAALEELLALRAPIGKRAGDLLARVFLAGDCLELGDRMAGCDHVDAALAATAGFGATHIRWIALRNAVLLRTLEGRLDDAEALAGEAAALAGRLGAPDAVMLQFLQILPIRYHQRRLDELHPVLAAFAAGEEAIDVVRITLGWVEAELGLGSAPTSVDAAVSSFLATPPGAAWVGVLALTVEAAARVAHPQTGKLAALLQPWTGSHVVIVTMAYLGAVDRYLGLAAGAAGDVERAKHLLGRAADQHRAIASPPYLARTEAELAALGHGTSHGDG